MEKSAGNCLRNGLTNLVIIVAQSAAFCARLESIRFGSWTVNATSRQFGRFVNFGVFWNKGGSFQTNTLASVLGTMNKLLTSHSETNCWNLRTLPLCFLIMQRNLKVSLTFFDVMNKITEKVDIFLLIWTREQINAFNINNKPLFAHARPLAHNNENVHKLHAFKVISVNLIYTNT